MTDEENAAAGDYNELRVHEVLVEPATGAAVALRIEVTWASHAPGASGEPSIWDRSIFVVAATGALAGAEVDDRLELRIITEDA